MIEEWKPLIQKWKAQEKVSAPSLSASKYLSCLKIRERWATFHWIISKASTLFIFFFSIYVMLTAFTWIGFAFFGALSLVATLATLTADPKFLGLHKKALDEADDYLKAQDRSILQRLISATCNLAIYVALMALALWADTTIIALPHGAQIELGNLRYLVLLGAVYEIWRTRQCLQMRSRLKLLNT